MTADEMGRMTLADLEAMAERFGAAVKTIREAQALLGGGQPSRVDGVGAGVAEWMRPIQVAPVVRGGDNPMLTAAENAERRRLIKLNTEPINPDDLEAMERT